MNNTIAGNSASGAAGSAIFASSPSTQTEFINNIMVGLVGQTAITCQGGPGGFPGGGNPVTAVFQNNDAYTTDALGFSGCSIGAGQSGNISADPLLANVTQNDVHLGAGSLAIDAGTISAPDLPATDFYGQPRTMNGMIDIGAAEYIAPVIGGPTPTATPTPTIIHVPTDQATIQGAIDVASDGNIVLVAPGTYNENIDFIGKAIEVMSAMGPSVTTINGGGNTSVVQFHSGESASSVLSGFTVTNGAALGAEVNQPSGGGGIDIEDCAPTILNNVVTGNTACNGGGGIYVDFGSALIQGNTISENA